MMNNKNLILIKILMKIVQSTDEPFFVNSGKTIDDFCMDYHLGLKKWSRWSFSLNEKKEIKQILHHQYGIDADRTDIEDFKKMNRSEMLTLTFNEKLNRRSVGEGKVRVKALKEHSLQIMDNQWYLFDRMDIGVDVDKIINANIGHDGLLIIENLQTFDDIFSVDACVMDQLILKNPLIVYRGDAQDGARADAVNQLIQKTSLPVVAFFDFDPSGLIMASRLPRLNQMLAPPIPILKEAIQSRGLIERYQNQVSHASKAFFDIKNDVRLFLLWETIYFAGKALPQEYFHASCSTHSCGKQNST